MDIRTGKTYESKEAALAAGVPESDVAEFGITRDTEYWVKFSKGITYLTPVETNR